MRASVASSSAAIFVGDQDATSAGPRMASGTLAPSATPASRDWPAGIAVSARLIQPLVEPCGRMSPLSSTFCASKCERSRYGVATACNTASSFAA